MKKILFFTIGALMALPSWAQQGEDVTSLITNPGFDEDLTIQADGTMKAAISTNTSLSNRSWAFIAADSTVYARPKSTSSQNRPDGRKMEAVNGFKGRIRGWKLESNGNFPNCEWTYFGSISYDLGETAIPISDDGSTYLVVPARPANGEFEAGEGFVYLRAGWTGQAIYKQVVSLPCAKYRLEYWTININPNTVSTVTDLTQIKCRRDVFKDVDNSKMQAQQWTKHEFEFTPTSEFTMQFGYQAANAGSGGMPIVALDGIKLYKIGDADPLKLIQSDLFGIAEDLRSKAGELADQGYSTAATRLETAATAAESAAEGKDVASLTAKYRQYEALLTSVDNSLTLISTLQEKAGRTDVEGLGGVTSEINTTIATLEGLLGSDDAEAVAAANQEAQALTESTDEIIAQLSDIRRVLKHLEVRLSQTDYPGKSEVSALYDQLNGYLTTGTTEQLLGVKKAALDALRNYIFSQHEATRDNPLDATYYIGFPWFINEELEPTLEDGKWTFDNSDQYVAGVSNSDLTMDGWVWWRNTTGGGTDLRTNWQQGRSCFNAWMQSDTTYRVAIVNYLTDMPEGYYTVSADLITEEECAGTQHVFASTDGDYSINDDYPCVTSDSLKVGNWIDGGEGEWTTLTTPYIYVGADGVLTLGAKGKHNQGDENRSAGWFLATNFRLTYYGKLDPRYKGYVASAEEPTDVTGELQNPKFDNNNYGGWQGTAFGGFNAVENAEHYEKNYNTYQTISDMPAGVYEVAVNAFYREGDPQQDYNNYLAGTLGGLAKLYAASSEKAIVSIAEGAQQETGEGSYFTVTDAENNELFLPNNMAAAEYLMHQKGLYQNKLMFHFDGGNLTVGVKKNLTKDKDWSLFDDFTLFYYGKEADAYQLMYDRYVEEAPRYADAFCTAAYLNAYSTKLQEGVVVSDNDTYLAAVASVKASQDSLTQNIALWTEYRALEGQAQEVIKSPEFTETDELSNYMTNTFATLVSQREADNVQLQQETARLNELIAEAKKHVSDGADVTAQYLVNPDFSTNDWTGWTREAAQGGNVAVASSCAEAWNNARFDIYQTVTDVPAGVYEISVQGFYRYYRGSEAWSTWLNQSVSYVKESPVSVYLNAMQTPFVNIFSEAITDNSIFVSGNYDTFVDNNNNTFYAPNDMATAANCFASWSEVNEGQRMFTQKAYGLVTEGQPLRIGVKGASNQHDDSWVIFDNFKLVYKGMDPEVIKPLLESQLAKAQEKQQIIMGKNAYTALTAAIDAANKAIEENDGDRMFAALDSLALAIDQVTPSAEVIQRVSRELAVLEYAVEQSENAEAKTVVEAFITAQQTAINTYAFDEADEESVIRQISQYNTLLLLPDYADASAENPIDMTAVLKTPDFDQNGTNSLYGWNVEGRYNFGNDEMQRTALALEFYQTTFDINQTVYGLPQGWYQVRVNAFFRSLNTPVVSTDDAYLYATADTTVLENETHIKYLENASVGQTITDMLTSAEAFGKGYYENRINVYVGEDGLLKLGMVKDAYQSGDWVILDSWKLFFTGSEELSEEAPEPDDLLVITDKQEIQWTNPDYQPSVQIAQTRTGNLSDYQFGALTLRSDVPVRFNHFTTVYDENIDFIQRYLKGNDGSFYSSFINEAQDVAANGITIEYWCYYDRWHFFTMPFDVKVREIGINFTDDTPFVIRRYNGAARAEGNLDATWENMGADATLKAGQGYIIHSGVYTDSRYYNGFFFNSKEGDNGLFFASGDITLPLSKNASSNESNAGWNLVGNPYPAFYNVKGLQTTAPITVWNDYTQNYEYIAPIDDDYVLNPGEGFFIQAGDNAQLTFSAAYRQSARYLKAVTRSRRGAALAADRYLFNLSLSDGQLTDKTRFVINSQADLSYERNHDAAKFEAINPDMPQLYTLSQGVRYAINERPAADGTLTLGFSVAKEGVYTIRLDNDPQNELYLVDHLNGTEQLLTAEGYQFMTEAGTFDGRFSLRLGAGEVTGIKNVTADTGAEPIYNLNGLRVQKARKGLYVKQGKKMVVK